MVKVVVGEDSRLTSAENRLSQLDIPAEVGLVIGKLSSVLDRGFVFDLIPTPINHAGEPACSVLETGDDKKKPSESSSLLIDSYWLAEHARRVSRMLLDGVKVVGVYVWATDSAFKNSTIILCQAIKGVSEAIRYLDFSLDEVLLIHIGYCPRRWNCHTCLLNSSITSSNLRPCDFELGTFKCSYSFNFSKRMDNAIRTKVGINGFGKTGRSVARAILERNDVELIAINEPCKSIEDMIAEFEYDSVYGPWNQRLQKRALGLDGCLKLIVFGQKRVEITNNRNLEYIVWPDKGLHRDGVDIVVDCSSTSKKEAADHVKAGAKRVILAAPTKDVPVFVNGVNEHEIVCCPTSIDTQSGLSSLVDVIVSIPLPTSMDLTLLDCDFVAQPVGPFVAKKTTVSIKLKKSREVVCRRPNGHEVVKMYSYAYPAVDLNCIISPHRDIGSVLKKKVLGINSWVQRRLVAMIRSKAESVMEKHMPYNVTIVIGVVFQKCLFEIGVEEEKEDEKEDEKETEKGVDCAICLGNFDGLAKCRTIQCGHTYHKSCIMRWQRKKNRCPYCSKDSHSLPC